ncbi:unannotated protein [freshwater metagenome]|uniref:Unannotated protein n=1 Tax=freshwater metagenome TaxID=449393 RepID=A0A6J7F9S1_9ZZZZ
MCGVIIHSLRPFTRAVIAILAMTALAGCSSVDQNSASSADRPKYETTLNVTTINGTPPEGTLSHLQNVKTMLDTTDAKGQHLIFTEGTRKAGTRAAIHTHEYGGHTCVVSGEITDFVEGHSPMKFPAGTCYYMPPNILMSASNLGRQDAVLIDTFTVPLGGASITIREPGY